MSTPNNNILREYAATANNPEYKGNWEIIDSKFPELKDYDKQVLREYAATANNPEYKGDWNIVDSKFPELFGSNNKPLTDMDKMRLGSFPVQAPTLNLEDKPAGQFYKPLPKQTSLYNPRLRENDMTGLTEEKTADARPALQKEFIAPTGEGIKQGHGAQAEASAQSAEYLANPQEQAQAQWELLNSTPQRYGTPRKDQFGNESWDLTADDQEYMNSLFDQLPERQQVEEWKKNPEKWNDRPFIQQFRTVADSQKSIFGDNWLGDASLAAGNVVEALNAGGAAVGGGLSEFVHQNIEKPLFGWVSKDPSSRLAFGRLADVFFEDQAYSSSAAGKHNTIDEDGNIRRKDFVDYIKEGDFASALGDLSIGALESAPTSAVAIGATMAGSPQVGLSVIGAQVAGSRKRELDAMNPELSEFQKNLIAYGSGAIEAGSEMLGDIPIGKMLGKLYKTGGTAVAENVMRNSVEGIIKTTTKQLKNGSILWKAPLMEGGEEFVSGVGNYLLDSAMGIQNFNFSEMMNQSGKQMAYGAVAGGGFGLVGTPGLIRNAKVAKELQTLKSQYDTANSNMQNAFADSEFEFEGEKIITLPLAQQQEILPAVYEAENLSDAQKTAIRDYMEAGNKLNAALVNVGLTNIELLRKKANAFKQVQESINDKTGKLDVITIQGTADTQQYNLKSGTVAIDNEGKVDAQNSDEAIYYYTGSTNEDGTPEVNIITPESISELTQFDPKEELKSRFTEIEAEEFVRSEFGAGMQIQVNSDAGLLPATVVAVTPTGLVANVQGQEVELSFEQAAQDVEAVEQPQQQPSAQTTDFTTIPTEELSAQYESINAALESGALNEQQTSEAVAAAGQIAAELEKRQQTVDNGQQLTYAPGTTAVVNGQTFVVAGKDEDGNYLINDENGQHLDRFTPAEMQEMGFVAAVKPTQSESVNADTQAEEERSMAVNGGKSGQQTAPAQPQYPINAKTGEIDFNQFTPEHHYQYAVETEGEAVAQQDLRNAIKDQFNIITKHKKKIDSASFEKKAPLRAQLKPLQEKLDALNALAEKYIPQAQPKPVVKRTTAEGTASATIEERWENAPKTVGFEDTLTLPNGEVINGRWVLSTAFAPTPSHNPETYQSSEGFPTTPEGKNVNDNDYTNKRAEVETKAADYDSRAIDDPIVVSGGVVVSGNNRTMSGQIAAKNGTDTKYVEALKTKAKKYGFTTEQVEATENPRIYFEVTDQLPLNVDTFAKFNARTSKSKSATEKAIVATKRNDAELTGKIMATIESFDSLADFYTSEKAQTEVLKYLLESGVINQNEVPELFENNNFTTNGRNYLEAVIIGNVMQEEQIKVLNLDGMKQYRAKIVRAIVPLLQNSKLAESMIPELNKAILYLYESGGNLMDYFSQQNMFSENNFDKDAVLLSIALQRTETNFKKFVADTNNALKDQTIDMFLGRTKTKDDVYEQFRETLNDTERATISNAERNGQPDTNIRSTENSSNAAKPDTGGTTTTGSDIREKLTPAQLDTQELDAYIASQSHNNKPTEKQKQAGEYDKARINLQGYNITLETLKGEQRSGKDSNGKAWAIAMNNHYGELDGTIGYDGDAIDVFIGPNPKQGGIFVVDQVTPEGTFDESKVMLGFDTAEQAKAAYMSNYEEGWQGFGSITPAGDNFKQWLYDGKKQRKPYAEYKETPEAVYKETTNPISVEKTKRFEVGKKLTKDEKQEILKGLTDSYKIMNRPSSFEDVNGVERFIWIGNANDYMQTSDITGRKLRWFITLPDGKIAHPTELYPELAVSEIKAFEDNIEKWDNTAKNDYKNGLKKIEGKEQQVYNALKKTLDSGAVFIKQYDSNDLTQKNPLVLLQFPNIKTEYNPNGIVKYVQTQLNNVDDTLNLPKFDFDWQRFYNEYKETPEAVEVEQELNPTEKTIETLGKRNIWIPNMKKSKLTKLLNKEVLSENDIEDLKDFQYFLLTDIQSATEKGFYEKLAVSQQGEAYVLKDKFLLTNIENKLNEAIKNQLPDAGKMIEKPAEATSAHKYKNGYTVYYQGKQYVINGIYNGVLAYDLETADGKLAFEEVAESELSTQAPAPRSILDVAVEQVKKNKEKAATNKIDEKEIVETDSKIQNIETQPKITATDEKIGDVGQKIGGAKKDLFNEYAKKLLSVTDQDIARLPLSKSFPRPNFAQLIEDGKMTQETAIFLNYFYDNIPTKPQKKYKVERWVLTVREALNTFNSVLENKPERDLMQEYIDMLNTNIMGQRKAFNAEVYRAVRKAINFPNNDVNVGNLTILRQQTSEGKYVYSVGSPVGNRVRLTGRFDTMEEAASKLIEMAKETAGKPKQIEFSVYSSRSSGDFYITPKGKGEIVLQNGFKTSKEAFEYINENREALTDRFNAMKEIPSERRMSNKERVGFDYRQGKNVTAEDFGKEFGFRGVEFGNWVNQEERQAHINEAYDALMDLASVIGVTPRALSLNGELGFAFGSRGGGKYAAHYETDKVVINLTKTKGAGTLAHEWFHALDNYLLRAVGNRTSYATEGPGFNKEGKPALRPELNDAFRNLMKVIRKSGFYTRSAKLDKLKGSKYWGTSIELGARGFEDFVMNKLAKSNIQNDYLVNFKSLAEFIDRVNGDISEITSKYPYPTMEESEAISEAYQNLFDTIQEDDNAVLFQAISPIGFYSTVEKALEAINQEKGTRDQFRAMLLKNGAKQAEMDWMGFDELPDKLTKADIQNWIDENRINIKEVIHNENDKKLQVFIAEPDELAEWDSDWEVGEWAEKYMPEAIDEDGYPDYNMISESGKWFSDRNGHLNTDKERLQYTEIPGDLKYSQYVLPGGENYKELLLTMPEKETFDTYREKLSKKYGEFSTKNDYSKEENEKLDLLFKNSNNKFKSSHFDEPNILAHVRFDEREVNGERVLFIEEFQSDWAQKGKKEGFKGDTTYDAVLEKENVWNIGGVKVLYFERGVDGKNYRTINKNREQVWFKTLDDAVKQANNTVSNLSEKEIFKVPNMPFRKTDQWVNLAARRMMRYAAENGFDRIAWTTGEQQADRYDLAKQVDRIVVDEDGGKYTVMARPIGKTDLEEITVATKENLSDYIGKELATKTIEDGGGDFSGNDLKVGGAGMKAFYDGIVPSAMSKLGKPFGAKVETIDIPETGAQQSIPVTDSMKETAMAGLPLYHTGTTMHPATPEEVTATVEQLLKTGLAKEVRMVTPEEIAGILEGNEQLQTTKESINYESIEEIPYELISKKLNRIGNVLIKLNGVEIPIKFERNNYSKDTMMIWIGKYGSQTGRELTSFNKKYDDEENAVNEIKEKINECYETFISNIKNIEETNKKIDEGYKQLSNYDVKNLIKETLQNWVGKETNAMSGSDYLNFAGHKLRFSDHTRPATSKWNFIHGENHIDAITGLLNKEELINWINKLTDNKLTESDKQNISNYFEEKIKTPEKKEIEYPNLNVQFFRTPSGTIYGFVKGGVVYLNSSTPNLNTPIHEFGHLWVDAIEGSELYNRGAELVKDTPYWERVNSDPNYKDLSEAARTKEAMAMAIGDKGEAVKRNIGLFARIKVWIADVWTRIGAKFGIQNLTPEQIQNLTFNDFVDVAVSELMSGENLAERNKNTNLATPINNNGSNEQTRLDNRRTMAGEPQRLPLGTLTSSNAVGKTIAGTTTTNTRTGRTTDAKSQSEHWNKSKGLKQLAAQAKADGTWIADITTLTDGKEHFANGTENNVYYSKDGHKVIKVNNLLFLNENDLEYAYTRDLNYFFDRISAHNILFPEDAYNIVGFTENEAGQVCIVMEQPYISSNVHPTIEEIETDLAKRGFTKTTLGEGINQGLTGYTNGIYELTDVKPLNVLKDENGNMHYIDLDISKTIQPSTPEKPAYKGDLGEYAFQVVQYNEQQAENATRTSKMQRLQQIMIEKRALATRHKNGEVSNQEYAKQMLALHEEKQRVMKGLPDPTPEDEGPDDTEPKPTRTPGQSITEYATAVADWNYRQTLAKALAGTSNDITGGLPPVDDDTDINGDMLRLELDQRLGGWFGRLAEGWQDNIRSVRIFQDMLKEKGTRVSDYNNFYMQYTALQGKNDAHLKDFGKRFMEAINANVLNIQKYTNYEYRDLENYVFLKHGIERNEYMREAAKAAAEAEGKKFRERDDYSGIYAIAAELWAKKNGIAFNPKKKGEVARIQKMDEFKADRDAVISEYIAQFEKTISETIIPGHAKGEQLTIAGFWAAINAATNYSLDRLVSSGIESKSEVDDLKARYQYYVPLRGHEVEAEKVWQYEAPDNKNVVSKAIMQASGRASRAEHPFAYIIQMAQTSINKANRNQLNQTMLRLARMDKSGLMSVSEAWYVLTGTDPDTGKEIWTETEPEFSEDHEIRAGEIRAWNEKMTKLEEEGKAKRFKKGLRIGGLFIKPKQRRQHAISVYEDGVLYQVYINGNPRVSQAINELNGTKWNIPIITQTTRFISSMITSRSPQFMLTNGARDLAFASSILPSKEGARYTGQFLKNYSVAMAILANDATFDFGNDKAKYKKYLKEFEMNGGETGYSHLLELQDIQKELYKKQKGKNYLNPVTDMEAIIAVIDAGNKVIENSTRLSVYITSRENGRSIERSVSDSKEVTLNFNRRGSGIMGAAHVQSLFMFVNAGVQALANFGHVYKMHPVRMSATIGAYAAVGFIMPMIINAIGGDDDEKEYMNMTDWERQTNLCIPTGSGFAKIPLPQEMRVFFKLGDEVYKLYSGRTEASETAMATLLSAVDMIPISPLGTIAAGEVNDFGDLQRAISPDALRSVAEIATNTNFMGGQIYDKYKAEKEGLPGYQKARLNRVGEPRAPESIVGFTKWLDNITGGDNVKKGTISLNPDVVNHLAKSYLGGMYSLISEGEKSFTKRFYTSNADIEEKNTTVKDYYKRIREAEEVLRQDKGYWEQVEKGEISEDTYNKAIPPALLEKAYTIRDYENEITKIERILKTGELTPDDELYYKHMSDSLKQEVIRIK